MNLTPNEVLALESVKRKEDHRSLHIIPILVSPLPEQADSQKIEVKQSKFRENVCQSSATNNMTIRDCIDDSIFYTIAHLRGNVYNIMRVHEPSKSCEVIRCFASEVTVISQLENFVFVGMKDSTLMGINKETKDLMIPVRVDGEICLLSNYYNRVLLCLTKKQVFHAWKIDEGCLVELMSVRFNGRLGNVQYIGMTEEVKEGALSPIIRTDEMSVRWSPSRNSWIRIDRVFPKMFESFRSLETVFEVEEFMKELMCSANRKLFLECAVISFRNRVRNEPISHAARYFNEMNENCSLDKRSLQTLRSQCMEIAKSLYSVEQFEEFQKYEQVD